MYKCSLYNNRSNHKHKYTCFTHQYLSRQNFHCLMYMVCLHLYIFICLISINYFGSSRPILSTDSDLIVCNKVNIYNQVTLCNKKLENRRENNEVRQFYSTMNNIDQYNMNQYIVENDREIENDLSGTKRAVKSEIVTDIYPSLERKDVKFRRDITSVDEQEIKHTEQNSVAKISENLANNSNHDNDYADFIDHILSKDDEKLEVKDENINKKYETISKYNYLKDAYHDYKEQKYKENDEDEAMVGKKPGCEVVNLEINNRPNDETQVLADDHLLYTDNYKRKKRKKSNSTLCTITENISVSSNTKETLYDNITATESHVSLRTSTASITSSVASLNVSINTSLVGNTKILSTEPITDTISVTSAMQAAIGKSELIGTTELCLEPWIKTTGSSTLAGKNITTDDILNKPKFSLINLKTSIKTEQPGTTKVGDIILANVTEYSTSTVESAKLSTANLVSSTSNATSPLFTKNNFNSTTYITLPSFTTTATLLMNNTSKQTNTTVEISTTNYNVTISNTVANNGTTSDNTSTWSSSTNTIQSTTSQSTTSAMKFKFTFPHLFRKNMLQTMSSTVGTVIYKLSHTTCYDKVEHICVTGAANKMYPKLINPDDNFTLGPDLCHTLIFQKGTAKGNKFYPHRRKGGDAGNNYYKKRPVNYSKLPPNYKKSQLMTDKCDPSHGGCRPDEDLINIFSLQGPPTTVKLRVDLNFSREDPGNCSDILALMNFNHSLIN